MAATVDERGRIVIPKRLVEELELGKGDAVIFEKVGEHFVVKKLKAPGKRLEGVMSWDPERTAKPERVSPQEMKRIWKT